MNGDSTAVPPQLEGTPWLVELLPALWEGDKEAQERVVQGLDDKLVHWLCGKGFDEDIAFDATQEGLARLLLWVHAQKPCRLHEKYI